MMKNLSLYFAIVLKFKKCYQFSCNFEAFEARFSLALFVTIKEDKKNAKLTLFVLCFKYL